MVNALIFFLVYLGLCFMMAPYILYKCSEIDRIGWSDAGFLVLLWPMSIPYMAFHGMAKFRAEHKQRIEQQKQEREIEEFEHQMEREQQVDQYLEDETDRLEQEFEELKQDQAQRSTQQKQTKEITEDEQGSVLWDPPSPNTTQKPSSGSTYDRRTDRSSSVPDYMLEPVSVTTTVGGKVVDRRGPLYDDTESVSYEDLQEEQEKHAKVVVGSVSSEEE